MVHLVSIDERWMDMVYLIAGPFDCSITIQWRCNVFDLSSPESTALLVTTIALAVSQMVKEKLRLEGAYAQTASSLVGAVLGVAWYAAWYTQLVDASNQPLILLGGLLAVLGFSLVPSGLYKFTMSAMDTASKGRG